MKARRTDFHYEKHSYDLRQDRAARCKLAVLGYDSYLLLFQSEDSELSIYMNDKQARQLYDCALLWARHPLHGLHLSINGGARIYAEHLNVDAVRNGNEVFLVLWASSESERYVKQSIARANRAIYVSLSPAQASEVAAKLATEVKGAVAAG